MMQKRLEAKSLTCQRLDGVPRTESAKETSSMERLRCEVMDRSTNGKPRRAIFPSTPDTTPGLSPCWFMTARSALSLSDHSIYLCSEDAQCQSDVKQPVICRVIRQYKSYLVRRSNTQIWTRQLWKYHICSLWTSNYYFVDRLSLMHCVPSLGEGKNGTAYSRRIMRSIVVLRSINGKSQVTQVSCGRQSKRKQTLPDLLEE